MKFLFLWISKRPIPKWRNDNIEIFRSFHPEAEIEFVWQKRDSKNPWGESDRARIEFCGQGENRGWIDSDIECLARLPFGERPAIAFESFPHTSICWSGSHPELFEGTLSPVEICKRFSENRDATQLIKPAGIYRHWATTTAGRKVPRLVMGYKLDDFKALRRTLKVLD